VTQGVETALIGLCGAAIGGAAAILGVFWTQHATDQRDRAERMLQEKRTRALFAGYCNDLRFILKIQIRDGMIWDLDQIERPLEPLRAIVSDATLMLRLEPKAIVGLTDLLGLLAINLRFAGEKIAELGTRREPESTNLARRPIDEEQRAVLKAAFVPSWNALNAVLGSLGYPATVTKDKLNSDS
jgi:hypothetical protein